MYAIAFTGYDISEQTTAKLLIVKYSLKKKI